MGDIEDLKQAIQHDFITPLSEFRTQVQPLDSIHDQSIEEFQRTIQALLGPSFRGAAANALTELVRHYLATERALGDYTNNRLSEHMAQAAASCERTVAAMEPTLASLQNFPGVAAAGAVMTQTEQTAQEYGGPPEPGNPLWDFIIVGGLAIAGGAFLWEQAQQQAKITELWQDVQQWQASMRHLAQQNEPTLPPEPSNIIPPMNSSSSLSDAQKRLLNDVRSRLGTSPYNDAEIEALIRAGYLDPDAIAAIIRGGSAVYALFNNPGDRANIATLMGELTPAQQQSFIALVEQYQRMHPGVTSHQIYNALRYTKMKAQLAKLLDNIGNDPTDPTSQEIFRLFPTQTLDMNRRLQMKPGVGMSRVTDPFTVTDDQLGGLEGNLTGAWGEWASIKQYYQQGKLVDFSVPLPGRIAGEVDIKINESGVEKWVEIKNITKPDRQWGGALAQAKKYAQSGAKDVILQFPQQGADRNHPDISGQRLKDLEKVRRDYPGTTFELRTGGSDHRIQIPFNPPSNNWGIYLP